MPDNVLIFICSFSLNLVKTFWSQYNVIILIHKKLKVSDTKGLTQNHSASE